MVDKKVQALKKAWDKAEAEQRALVIERAEKRNSMSKVDFRKYNDETRDLQKEVAQKVRDAQKAYSDALSTVGTKAIEQTVGTISESGDMN